MLAKLKRLTDGFLDTPWLLWPAVVACLAACVVGTTGWYGDFFIEARVPVWAYPFVPDCPLAAGIFGLAIALRHLKRPSRLIDQWAAVFCVKYGTWTMTFWALYWVGGGPIEMTSLFSGPVMFLTHLGLTIMGLLLITLYIGRPRPLEALVVLIWFAASDFVDYAPIAPQRYGGYGYYPPLPPVRGDYFALVPAMQLHALIMTWLLAGGQLIRAWIGRRGVERAAAQAV